MPRQFIPKYEPLIKVWLAFWQMTLHSFYQVSYHNTDHLKPFKNKPFILLPKHQTLFDPALESILLHRAIRGRGNYLMKDSLPSFLEYFGAVKISRGKDVRTCPDRRAAIKEAKLQRDEVEDYLCHLLRNNEILVIHPEGTRTYKQPGTPNTSTLTRLLRIQKRVGKPIPFVPLDISYEQVYQPGSKIKLSVGTPIVVEDDGLDQLVTHLVSEVSLFYTSQELDNQKSLDLKSH